ncbi:hypothetical protein KR51_00025510 [Rubidibacter lacunae KORDI 51-2]|uniref:YdhG-like domain-containing protein n=1 Tax=Rubidibacter lacunae KORDI 51-2 TaxID=582515 RepID=U5D8G2_9CHRO|nr:hypothetical protein KR51_00025510 [Rubidibacter lacunae KORDI 51-2]
MKPFTDPQVHAVYDGYPQEIRNKLLSLRELIFEVAASLEGVGDLEEALKWGEPAYLTSQTKSGTTIRLTWKPSEPNSYAMLFHCQTNLVATFRERYPEDLEFQGNRAIVFQRDSAVPVDKLSECVASALLYHQNKNLDRFR